MEKERKNILKYIQREICLDHAFDIISHRIYRPQTICFFIVIRVVVQRSEFEYETVTCAHHIHKFASLLMSKDDLQSQIKFHLASFYSVVAVVESSNFE